MLAQSLHISCSKRCELLLALTCVLAPESLIPVAARLATNEERSATRLATLLAELPRDQAKALCLKTLLHAGVASGLATPLIANVTTKVPMR